MEEIKAAKQDLLKKKPEKKEEEVKSHKADADIGEKREERKNLATALGIEEKALKEKLKPLKARADCKLGIKPGATPQAPKLRDR